MTRTNKPKIVLIGGGGHCKACIDVIEQEGKYEIHGILDRPESVGSKVLDYDIIGTDDLIPSLAGLNFYFLITVGQIKSGALRKKIFSDLKRWNANIASVVSPHAFVSGYAQIGAGTIVMHHALINASASIGQNCIINTGALIEHDVTIGDHCHISTHAVINGTCSIGNEVFIGSNATVVNNITITENVIVGAAALVNRSLIQPGIYIGNPAGKYEKE